MSTTQDEQFERNVLAAAELRDSQEPECFEDWDDAQYDPHDFEDLGGSGVEPR